LSRIFNVLHLFVHVLHKTCTEPVTPGLTEHNMPQPTLLNGNIVTGRLRLI